MKGICLNLLHHLLPQTPFIELTVSRTLQLPGFAQTSVLVFGTDCILCEQFLTIASCRVKEELDEMLTFLFSDSLVYPCSSHVTPESPCRSEENIVLP